MPEVKTDDGCIIHVEVEGPQTGPVLMLSNSLGTNLHMWDDQVPAWNRHFRLVRYDRRGHGKSSVPNGPYPMERLGRDVLAVLDALGIAKINWCGLSMGGMVGQWLGANAPNRIDKLVLSNTSSYFADKSLWEGRLKTVREKGLAAIVDANMERWFTKEFRDRNPQAMARMREMFLATKPEGYSAAAKASATWIIVHYLRKSPRRRWSSLGSRTLRRRSKQTSSSSSIFPAPSSPCSKRRTSPMSSSRRPMRIRYSSFC
jgi:3-oxoadipate enol-lactonase